MASGLIGYLDALSVMAGRRLGIKVSSAKARACALSLHRVVGASWTDAGVVPDLQTVEHPASGTYPCEYRVFPAGSYGLAPAPSGLARTNRWSLAIWVHPTRKTPARAAIMALEDDKGALVLGMDDAGCPEIRHDGRTCAALDSPIPRAGWSSLVCTFEGGKVELSAYLPDGRQASASGRIAVLPDIFNIRFAAARLNGTVCDHFDGRLESPVLALTDGATLMTALRQGRTGLRRLGPKRLADWNFARGIDGQRIIDEGPERCDGHVVNRPARAVTGAFWNAQVFDWRQDPDQYGAIHFHADDLDDCAWPDDITLDIPEDWQPGLYIAEVRNSDGCDRIPFAVRAPASDDRPRLAVLLPTFTYLSYGNAQTAMRGPDFGISHYPGEQTLAAHPEVGRSHYDLHTDRSPAMYASPRRPLLSMRFGLRPWGLPVDAALLGYLEHLGVSYDILTDEDLHREGLRALRDYRCVITGNHPEYCSAEMLDAVEAFTHRGGRLMYLGGNGFYWRVSVCPQVGTLELRRAENGTRAWTAAPGEAYHAMDGQYGGLWRRLGRPPNKLVDVGFAAQGDFDVSGHYVIHDNVRDGVAGFCLEGVEGPTFGDYGWLGDGAAGQEIDRADLRLGTSPDTIILASSTGHTPAMMRTIEEMLSSVPPFDDPKARSDITFRALPGGGAVFSAGSMTWIASLDHAGFDNDVARITGNVIRRFLDPAPLTAGGE